MHQGVIMTESLYAALVPWVERHYRDRVEPKDLADPQLAIECATALEELERLLGLPGLYNLD
jgi:succinylarginine dihydrolase